RGRRHGSYIDPNGWTYTGRDRQNRTIRCTASKYLRDLYLKADPNYNARFTVPVLWDKKKLTIVNSESSEIIRMPYFAFDAFRRPSPSRTEQTWPWFIPRASAARYRCNERLGLQYGK
ncbi:hypothetical protein LIPSTDRAFT_334905, partial [Lipomyces starkeyi NRRL Y-11557]